MSKCLDEFNRALQEKSQRIKNTNIAIKEKTDELEETKKAYEKAELGDNAKEASKMFAKTQKLKIELEQLKSRRKLLESEKDSDEVLDDLAEKIRQETVEELKNLNDEKSKYMANIAVIEQERIDKLKENGTNLNQCISSMLSLANEIAKIVDYIPSYTETDKKTIKEFGSDRVLRIEGMGI